jgi:general secretion pathway protein I
MRRAPRGFTLVEVLVALVVVAIGLAALMVAVSGAARTSGYLRDKTLAEWIALNRLTEVRLTINRTADTNDAAEIDFANRTWHYDTRYFDTSVPSMKRVVVRVWQGNAKTKGNPIAESTSFIGSALGVPGMSNVDWRVGSTGVPCPTSGSGAASTTVGAAAAGGAAATGAAGGSAAQTSAGVPGTNCIPTASGTTPATTTPTTSTNQSSIAP